MRKPASRWSVRTPIVSGNTDTRMRPSDRQFRLSPEGFHRRTMMMQLLCALENKAPNCCVRYRTQLLVFIGLNYTLAPLKRSTRHHSQSTFEIRRAAPQ